MRETSLHFALGDRPCLSYLPPSSRLAEQYRPYRSAPLEPLVEVPARQHYAFRVDGNVAILAISRFVDPSDAGWAGFAEVLRKLVAHDLIVIDLQNARRTDPRMGLAVLAALRREGGKEVGWHAAASDSPYAQVARANLAAHPPRATAHAPPLRPARSRALETLERIATAPFLMRINWWAPEAIMLWVVYHPRDRAAE